MIKLFQILLTYIVIFNAHSATTSLHIRPWPNSTFYYYLESGFSLKVESRIRSAINEIASLNIVRFIEVKGEDYPDVGMSVFLDDGKKGCNSHVGWNDDVDQVETSGGGLIRITEECSKGTIMHEILHALGFKHEHVNPLSGLIFNFDRLLYLQDQYEDENALALTDYDPHSIMNYSSIDLSVCHQAKDSSFWSEIGLSIERLPHESCRGNINAIIPLKDQKTLDCQVECAVFTHPEYGLIQRQRDYLSPLDIEGLRKLYPKRRKK